MSETRRLMCIHAHPDDESSKGAATMAKYAQEGRVRVVTCTGGERGSILNASFYRSILQSTPLPEVRRKEMAQAAAALGIEQVFLGFVDSGLPEGYPDAELPEGCFALAPDAAVIPALVAQIREFKPQVVTTYDENGGYPHPDHQRVHDASMKAIAAAATDQWPELGEPWQVSKVYYDVSFSFARIAKVNDRMLELGLKSPFAEWMERAANRPRPPHEATARIHVSEFFDKRDAALRAHASQIDPDGWFFAAPRDIEAEVWPYEDFYLAQTRVGERTEGLEADLFERVPGLDPAPNVG